MILMRAQNEHGAWIDDVDDKGIRRRRAIVRLERQHTSRPSARRAVAADGQRSGHTYIRENAVV